MSSSEDNPQPAPAASSRFATTRWSIVLAAQDHASPQSQGALAALCTAYWYPLYVYVRRKGHDPHEAQDLTQEFFARLLEKDYLQVVDRQKGKFRSYLLVAFGHFLSNEYDRAAAQKRGGGRQTIAIDFHAAENRYGQEPAHALTAEKLFERRWVLTLLDGVLGRLREEWQDEGKARLFDALKMVLVGEKSAATYNEIGAELGMSEGAIKVAVHRLRSRYRELLREQIEQTVDDPARIDEEIRELFAALGP
jgi:RNA polymerase sigma factor (sigma-70 family)